MKRKFIAVLVLFLMLLCGGCGAEKGSSPDQASTVPAGQETALETDQPFLSEITTEDLAIAYVLVRVQGGAGLLPLPLEGEYTKTIRQVLENGTEMINVLHLTPEGFWMESANCEGQDCVDEGMVTLENREERVLWNLVICLPHQLSAELLTREEAESLFH